MAFEMRFNYSLTVLIAWMLLMAAPRAVAQTRVVAEAEPSTVMVGDTGTYTVRFINAGQLPEMAAPRVDGLIFSETASTGSFQQIINGRISSEKRLSWNFQALREGAFLIPARTVRVDGQTLEIPATRVSAVPVSEERRSRALLDVQIPEGPYYVGQALPTRVSLLVRRDLELANAAFPQRQGDAFVNTEFSDSPARGTTEVGGRAYGALQWNILVTPIHSGQAELSFTQEVLLQLPSNARDFGSLFSFRTAQTERSVLQSEPQPLLILPLPAEGRPASFDGAIGQLSVSADVSTTRLTQGEPVTLTLSITGSGNFDRIVPPALPEWDGWRIYPPKSDFTPGDATGFSGTKTFAYILIPQTDQVTEIPEVAYASFDPKTARYVETILPAIPVTVAPATTPVAALPRLTPENREEPQRVPAELMPLRPVIGRTLPPTAPAWTRPGFWILQGAILTMLIILAVWLRRIRQRSQNDRLARHHIGSRRVRAALKLARAEAASGAAAPFFASARLAIQESISRLSPRAVEAKTLVTSDCLGILDSVSAHHDLRSSVQSLLDAADAHAFAGHQPDAARLAALLDSLEQIVSELNKIRL